MIINNQKHRSDDVDPNFHTIGQGFYRTVWATGTGGLLATEYSSRINDKVVFLQYDGDHGYPYTVPPLIARYFKEVAADILATTTTPLITRVYPINKSLPAKSLY